MEVGWFVGKMIVKSDYHRDLWFEGEFEKTLCCCESVVFTVNWLLLHVLFLILFLNGLFSLKASCSNLVTERSRMGRRLAIFAVLIISSILQVLSRLQLRSPCDNFCFTVLHRLCLPRRR